MNLRLILKLFERFQSIGWSVSDFSAGLKLAMRSTRDWSSREWSSSLWESLIDAILSEYLRENLRSVLTSIKDSMSVKEFGSHSVFLSMSILLSSFMKMGLRASATNLVMNWSISSCEALQQNWR